MKILFYINVLGGGGAERVIANLATQFSEKGYDVDVVASFPVEKEYSVGENVNLVYLNQARSFSHNRIIKNIQQIYTLRKIIKHKKADIVISFMAEPNFRSIIATIGLSTKTLVSVRNDPDKEYAGRIGRLVGKFVLPMADGCVFQTEDAQKWFPDKLQKKSRIIYNAVNKNFYTYERKPVPGRISTFGRLNSQKNQMLLINAFSALAQSYHDISLRIYGDGELYEKLTDRINHLGMSDRIRLMGNTANVLEELSKTDIFVLSSDYEGMPNALMEALAMGIPCISTDCPCGGPKMLISNKVNGMLVPVNDQDKLVEALQYLVSNPEKKDEMGMQASAGANQFEPDKIFADWEEYICAVCRPHVIE